LRTGIEAIPVLDVSKNTRRDWRKLGQLDEEKLDRVIDFVRELDDNISTAAVVKAASADAMGIHYSSATDEWATPLDFYEVVNQEFKFELDVCALPSSAKCERYFTPEDDGLAQNWNGRIWMNPPYGTEIVDWITKAHQSSVNGTIVAALVPARVDTNWWWDHCRHAEIRFLRGRLKFGNVGTAAPFPSALVIFGREPKVVWWEWKV
jgi:phage N-6-adenine-methyltransferase